MQVWEMSPEMPKDGDQQYRPDTRHDEQSAEDDGRPEQKSLEAIQLPTNDRHIQYLRIHP